MFLITLIYQTLQYVFLDIFLVIFIYFIYLYIISLFQSEDGCNVMIDPRTGLGSGSGSGWKSLKAPVDAFAQGQLIHYIWYWNIWFEIQLTSWSILWYMIWNILLQQFLIKYFHCSTCSLMLRWTQMCVTIRSNSGGVCGFTLLHFAAFAGKPKACQALINLGATCRWNKPLQMKMLRQQKMA